MNRIAALRVMTLCVITGLVPLASLPLAAAAAAPDDPAAALVARLDLERYKATIKELTRFGDRRQGRGGWLRRKVAQAPKAGTDTLIITHAPNIREAFPTEGNDMADGEALIFRPDGQGGASLVARVKIQDWPTLSAAS